MQLLAALENPTGEIWAIHLPIPFVSFLYTTCQVMTSVQSATSNYSVQGPSPLANILQKLHKKNPQI